VLEAHSVVEQVGTAQVACTEAELPGGMVAPAVALPVAVAMAVHVESLLERSALLVVSAAAVEDPVQAVFHTWEQARDSTYKKQRISMWVLEVILTQFDQGEISLASSPVVVA